MALWNKLKLELDRAGKVAQGALDEGRLRLEAFRARQLADKAAQALGYAIFRARQENREPDGESYVRLSDTLATHDAEAVRYDTQLSELLGTRKANSDVSTTSPPPADSASATPPL